MCGSVLCGLSWPHDDRHTPINYVVKSRGVKCRCGHITETVFSRPGLGTLIVKAILWNDYPLVQGAVLFMGTSYVVVNLLVDLLYAWLNPRIHYSEKTAR